MAQHTPAEYAGQLKPHLERGEACAMLQKADTCFRLRFPAGMPCCPEAGETTLQIGLAGYMVLQHEVCISATGLDRTAVLEMLNRANGESCGEVTFSLHGNNLLRCMAVLHMDACSGASARHAADEIRQRMSRISMMLPFILAHVSLRSAEEPEDAENMEAGLLMPEEEDFDIWDDDDVPFEDIFGCGSSKGAVKAPADAAVAEELYAMLAWAHIRGVDTLSPRQQRLLYDLLGESLLREEEMLRPTVAQLCSALPEAAPWGELNLLGDELPWEAEWGNEKIFLRLAEQEDLSALSGSELLRANRALERQTRRLSLRAAALRRFQRACTALKNNLAEN